MVTLDELVPLIASWFVDEWGRLWLPDAGKHYTYSLASDQAGYDIKQQSNITAKRGNPALKFDLIYDVLINNLNALRKYAKADRDETTTWGLGGYGKAGSGLAGRIMEKPGIM